MAYKLLEEAVVKDKTSNISNPKPNLKDICARLVAIESSTQNLSLPQNVKTELEEILNRITALERKVNVFPSGEQVATTTLSKVTSVLEQLTHEITRANYSDT